MKNFWLLTFPFVFLGAFPERVAAGSGAPSQLPQLCSSLLEKGEPIFSLSSARAQEIFGISRPELLKLEEAKDLVEAFDQLSEVALFLEKTSPTQTQLRRFWFEQLTRQLNLSLLSPTDANFEEIRSILSHWSGADSEDPLALFGSGSAPPRLAKKLAQELYRSLIWQLSQREEFANLPHGPLFTEFVTRTLVSMHPQHHQDRFKHQFLNSGLDVDEDFDQFLITNLKMYIDEYLWPRRDKAINDFLLFVLERGPSQLEYRQVYMDFKAQQEPTELDKLVRGIDASASKKLISLRHKFESFEVASIKEMLFYQLIEILPLVEKAVFSSMHPEPLSFLDYDRDLAQKSIKNMGYKSGVSSILLELFDYVSVGLVLHKFQSGQLEYSLRKAMKSELAELRRQIQSLRSPIVRPAQKASPPVARTKALWLSGEEAWLKKSSSPAAPNPNKRKTQSPHPDSPPKSSLPSTPNYSRPHSLAPLSLKVQKNLASLGNASVADRLVHEIFPQIAQSPYTNGVLAHNVFRKHRVRRHKVNLEGLRLRIAYHIKRDMREIEILAVGQRRDFYEMLERSSFKNLTQINSGH